MRKLTVFSCVASRLLPQMFALQQQFAQASAQQKASA
jgi:hypothetical protein